jgi:hypothetical protein
MTSQYKLLPQSADHVQIAQIVRDCVRKMRAHEMSYRKIAQHVSSRTPKRGVVLTLTEASLKTFMSRDLNRVNSNNTTLEILYNYIFEEVHRLEPDVRSVVMSQWSVFNPSLATDAGDAQKTRRRVSHDISALLCKWIIDSDPSVTPAAM